MDSKLDRFEGIHQELCVWDADIRTTAELQAWKGYRTRVDRKVDR